MKKIKILAIVAVTVAAALTPGLASATDARPSAPTLHIASGMGTSGAAAEYRRPGACRHAWMRVWTGNLAVRAEPRADAREVDRIAGPTVYPCRAMQVGGLYRDVCGADNTGWVLIPLPNHPYPAQGWIPNQCTEDPVLWTPSNTGPVVWEWSTDPVSHQRPGACRHAWMTITAKVNVRSEPRTDAPVLAYINSPRISPCRAMQVGGLYRDVCGADNTGWVLIPLGPDPAQGWIPSQCTADPVL